MMLGRSTKNASTSISNTMTHPMKPGGMTVGSRLMQLLLCFFVFFFFASSSS